MLTLSQDESDAGRQPASRLALGTAQFGSHYGVANRHGRPRPGDVREILALARASGIDTIDTAAAYGDAEAVLGAAETADFRVISKVPPGTQPGGVQQAIDRSLSALRRPRLAGLLLHEFVPADATLEMLSEMRADPRAGRIGVSVYHPAEVEWLLAHHAPLDLVQAPFSVFDQRFIETFRTLAASGIEVHARSVFLQGLYFLKDEDLVGVLEAGRAPLQRLRELAEHAMLPLATILLRYVAEEHAVGRIVIGVETVSQLRASIDAMKPHIEVNRLLPDLEKLALDNEDVLLPGRWNMDRLRLRLR